MKLKAYLNFYSIKQNKFAETAGIKASRLNNYVLEKRIPDPEAMRKIYIATSGMVTPNDFYDLPEGSVCFASSLLTRPNQTSLTLSGSGIFFEKEAPHDEF